MKMNQYTDGSYLAKVSDWHSGDSLWKSGKVLKMIEKHSLLVNEVHEIGCGAGEVLVNLQKKMGNGVSFSGYDISPQAINIAKPKENDQLKFYNKDYLKLELDCPNLILLLDVFEHVPDYIGFLEKICEKSQWIIFHIPLDICAKAVLRKSNYMIYMRESYGHLHYFTRETALATLIDTGFEIVDYFYTDDYEITDEMIPRSLRPRISYEIRKILYKIKPNTAISSFSNFNLMLLAKGKSGLT